jgi:uncharacterized protein YuzE
MVEKRRRGEVCERIAVPKRACYLLFGKKEGESSDAVWLGVTVRGEHMVADLDGKGRVLGIELLASKHARKPCQEKKVAKVKP